MLAGVILCSVVACRTCLAHTVLNGAAVGHSHACADGAVAVVKEISLIAARAGARVRVDGGTEWVEPHALSIVEVECLGALLTTAIGVKGFAVRVGKAYGTIAVGQLVSLIAAGTVAILLVDCSTQRILDYALSAWVEKVAGEALLATATRTERLTISITIQGLGALAVVIVELIALIAAGAESVGRVEGRTLAAHLLAGLSIKPITLRTSYTAVGTRLRTVGIVHGGHYSRTTTIILKLEAICTV